MSRGLPLGSENKLFIHNRLPQEFDKLLLVRDFDRLVHHADGRVALYPLFRQREIDVRDNVGLRLRAVELECEGVKTDFERFWDADASVQGKHGRVWRWVVDGNETDGQPCSVDHTLCDCRDDDEETGVFFLVKSLSSKMLRFIQDGEESCEENDESDTVTAPKPVAMSRHSFSFRGLDVRV